MSFNIDNSSVTILIIDDEESIRKTLTLLLRSEKYDVRLAESFVEAVEILDKEKVDLVLTDLRLEGQSGLDVIKKVRQSYPGTESILLTAYGSIESAVEAIQAGALDYVTKPFSNDQLLLKVQKAVERKLMQEELIRLRQHMAMSYGFDNIVGISKQIMKRKETARRIAPTDITVLITGASGTGKELFARAIHHHSERRNSQFVAIDCSAIPESLMESELFGHAKGSFTSAHRDRVGLFEEAHNGTIFLDEVSNMPPSVQVKLLRFLQDSEIRPVGSAVTKRVNVRIIAATNRDLGEMVGNGEFREDLYYRLNVIPLDLPTLTERAEDMEILTDYFIRKICSEIGRQTMTVTRAVVDKLLCHTWPGNVRELENTLKRALALCSGNQLDADDIMFISTEPYNATGSPLPAKRTLRLKGNLLDNSQRSIIIKALNDNNWNYTKTASELGIGRTTLWRKMRKYDLRREVLAD